MSETACTWEEEVRELHRFFQGWLNGELGCTRAVFDRVEGALMDGFTLAGPDERTRERAEVLDGLWEAHGREVDGELVIEIHEVFVREVAGGLALVSYEEWHVRSEATTVRESKAVLGRSARAPSGIGWMRLQETWREAGESPG